MRRWPLIVIALVVIAGCGQEAGERGAPAAQLSPEDFDVAWTDADGVEVSDGVGEPDPDLVINTIRGPEHCDWESAVMLHLAVPIGEVASGPEAHRQYVRDPGHVLPQERLQDDFEPVAELPPDAESTGLRNGEIELWVAESTLDDEVYVGRDESFEAWPRATEPIGCG